MIYAQRLPVTGADPHRFPQFYGNRSAYMFFRKKKYIKIYIKNAYKKTSNNQRLRSAGDNDRRSKRFRPIAVLCAGKFHVAESQTTRNQINSR